MAFLAIRVPEKTIHDLPLAWLASQFPDLEWVRPLDLHLTLRFFGNQDTDMTRLIQSLAKNRTEIRSFELTLEGAGLFDRGEFGGVIWLSLAHQPEPLQQLQSELEAEARRLKYWADYRPFVPHITLARYKASQKVQVEELLQAIQENPAFAQTFAVKAFVLMKRMKNDPQRFYQDIHAAELLPS